MKRDERLHALSTDHHHALVLARRASAGTVDVAEVGRRYETELAPHFALEERVLLPALRQAGAPELVDRTEREHVAIREALDAGDLATFGELLAAHVRFEERELFPACEEKLSAAVLDAVASRHLH